MPKEFPFEEVTFCERYPTGYVADHEVFMSFNNDSDAVEFREWRDEDGASIFARWVEKKKRKR